MNLSFLLLLKIDGLIKYLISAKDTSWSDVTLQSDQTLFARHKLLVDPIQVHLICNSNTVLPLLDYKYPGALAINTDPDGDERLRDLRGAKRLEESDHNWLVYLLKERENK